MAEAPHFHSFTVQPVSAILFPSGERDEGEGEQKNVSASNKKLLT